MPRQPIYRDENGKACSNCQDYFPYFNDDGSHNFGKRGHNSWCRTCTRAKNRTRIVNAAKHAIVPLDHLYTLTFFPICPTHGKEHEYIKKIGTRRFRACRLCYNAYQRVYLRRVRRNTRFIAAKAAGVLPGPIPKVVPVGKHRGKWLGSRRRTCTHPESSRYLSPSANKGQGGTRCRDCRKLANRRQYEREGSARGNQRRSKERNS